MSASNNAADQRLDQSIDGLITATGVSIGLNLSGLALTLSAVVAILKVLVRKSFTGTLNISGGTNAAPLLYVSAIAGIASGGTGYAVNDVIIFDPTYGSGAAGHVAAVTTTGDPATYAVGTVDFTVMTGPISGDLEVSNFGHVTFGNGGGDIDTAGFSTGDDYASAYVVHFGSGDVNYSMSASGGVVTITATTLGSGFAVTWSANTMGVSTTDGTGTDSTEVPGVITALAITAGGAYSQVPTIDVINGTGFAGTVTAINDDVQTLIGLGASITTN